MTRIWSDVIRHLPREVRGCLLVKGMECNQRAKTKDGMMTTGVGFRLQLPIVDPHDIVGFSFVALKAVSCTYM